LPESTGFAATTIIFKVLARLLHMATVKVDGLTASRPFPPMPQEVRIMARTTLAPATETDEELIGRVRNHDDSVAFETLVHRYERELFAYLRRYLGDAGMAEDVFQSTFLLVHRKRARYVEGRPFRPWLYAIATNQAIDAQRRNRRHRMASLDRGGRDHENGFADSVADAHPSGDDTVAQQDAEAWMLAAIDRLPEPLRRTLALVYRSGLKHREVADALGIPVGTVKSRLNTAIGRLHASCVRAC